MKITLIILYSFLSYICISQDTLFNQYNREGEKQGCWTVYLDSLMNPIDYKEEAYFIAYESYDNGERVFKHDKEQNSDLDSIVYNFKMPIKGKPELINGIFEGFNSNGQIIKHEEYVLGWPKYCKSYQYFIKKPHKCPFIEVLDWTKMHEGIKGTFYYEEFLNCEVIVKGWFRKGKKGWKVYKIKE